MSAGSARPVAVILGSEGQDGYFLTRLLDEKGFDVAGIGRNRMQFRGCSRAGINICDARMMSDLLAEFRPAHVYHLAAHHFSSETSPTDTGALIRKSIDINTISLANVLEAIRVHSPLSRLFYASSSRVFGDPPHSPQNEFTPIAPKCPYGISKAAAMALCKYYRERFGVFASAGILYNHESLKRSSSFLLPRLIRESVALSRGERDIIEVGNLSSVSDWGAAPDFADAFYRILLLPEPDDFVVATGEGHSVRDLLTEIFRVLGRSGISGVQENKARIFVSPSDLHLIGDPSYLASRTGWSPSHAFSEFISLLVEEELKIV